jgi:hypothetical protein
MSGIQSKIIRYAMKQENTTPIEEVNKPNKMGWECKALA